MSTRHPKGRRGGSAAGQRLNGRIEAGVLYTLPHNRRNFSSAVLVRRHASAGAVSSEAVWPFLRQRVGSIFGHCFLSIYADTDSCCIVRQDKHCTLSFSHFSRRPFQCQKALPGITVPTSEDHNEEMQMAVLYPTKYFI